MAALPQNIVRLSHRSDGVELYFPPLRTPEVALALGFFGLLCLALPLFAIIGLLPAGGTDAHGLLVIALLGAFVAPFPVFGTVFVALAIYMLANSLTVNVSPLAIRTVRCVFGFRLSRREIGRPDIATIEAQIAAKYQNLFSTEPYFRLVVRHATQHNQDLVVAESLKGEALMVQVRELIAGHAGLDMQQS